MRKESHRVCPFGLPRGIDGFITEAMACFDGQYQLFFGERSFPYGFRKCSLANSSDLLDWKKQKTVLRPHFLEPAFINAGAAIPRNGKTVYLYHKKTLFCDSIRMVSTADFIKFEKHPVPVLTARHLPKKARGISAPRLFKSGDFYYMLIASAMRKGGMILLYRSPNLIDWDYRGMLACETEANTGKSALPALVQVDGKHILLEQRTQKSKKVFGYRVGSARPEECCFTPFCCFKTLDYLVSPRITTLSDGRTVLLSGVENIEGGCDKMGLPKEIACEEKKLFLRPVRELYARRNQEITASFTAKQPVNILDGLNGRTMELNIFADLTKAASLRIMAFMTGCRGLFINIIKDRSVAELDFSTLVKKNKNKCPVVTVPLTQTDKLDLQLILLGDRFECFFNRGEATVSRGLNAALTGGQIGLDAEGEAPCEIVAYQLK